jgi:hypothetical protein
MPAPSSAETTAAPLQFALPPTPSRDLEVVVDKYRGFRRPLRCLAINTAVARPADDGLHRGTVKADLLMSPGRRHPVELFGPLPPVALRQGGGIAAAGRRSAKLERSYYFMLNLPRLHGARSPSNGTGPCRCPWTGADCWRSRRDGYTAQHSRGPGPARRMAASSRRPLRQEKSWKGEWDVT